MNSKQFEELIKASKDVEVLNFRLCEIRSDNEIDLDDQIDYKIKTLNFDGIGHSRRSNWKSNKQRVDNIVKAICNSKLKHSLQKLHFSRCEYDVDKIKNLCKDESAASIQIDKSVLLDLSNQ